MTPAYFAAFARYNEWANERLYGVAATLTQEELEADRGAFFRSVLGTLNHLLVTDRIWMWRLTGEGVAPSRLDEILFDDLEALDLARKSEDVRIIAYADGLSADDLAETLQYRNMAGKSFAQMRGYVLGHLFNHQTHHRGQLHALLTGLGRSVPPLDILYFYQDRPDVVH